MKIRIGERWVGEGEPTYVIAEIGSNFDGDLNRAKKLIKLAKDCGADCVKFQSFKTEKIIYPQGFKMKSSFQAAWKKDVAKVYKNAEFPPEWHAELSDYCKTVRVDFSSTPYYLEAIDLLADIGVPFFKVGSGDITFPQLLEHIAKKGKPILLATGASTLEEVKEAIGVIKEAGNDQIVLLQCVTNYPSPLEDANVRVLQTFKDTFGLPVGYSDHTPGSMVPIAAVALGACVIEKHFTDDKTRDGPDHPFAMDAADLRQMIRDIRLVERVLGSPEKKVYPSESETVILQRRCLRAAHELKAGSCITGGDVALLRPAPKGSLPPKYLAAVVGKTVKSDIAKNDLIRPEDVEGLKAP